MAETLDGVLCLNGFGAEEGVLLETNLIFDNHRRDTVTLQRSNGKDKVLGFAACVTIVDDGFGGTLENVVQVLHAGCQIDSLDVGLAFRGGIGQRTRPHAIEGYLAGAPYGFKILDNQTTQSVVNLQDAHDGLGSYQSAQGPQTDIGGGADFLDFLIKRRRIDAFGIRNLNDLAAYLLHGVENLLAQFGVDTLAPVVAMNDVIRTVFLQVRHIAPFVLRNNLADAFDILDNVFTLIVCHVRKALMGGNGFICEKSNHHVTIFRSFMDDVYQTWVHNITYHAQIYSLIHVAKVLKYQHMSNFFNYYLHMCG